MRAAAKCRIPNTAAATAQTGRTPADSASPCQYSAPPNGARHTSPHHTPQPPSGLETALPFRGFNFPVRGFNFPAFRRRPESTPTIRPDFGRRRKDGRPFSTQSRKLPRLNDANPLANRTDVLYPAFSKSGSTAVGRTSPACHAKVHGAPPDLPFLENRHTSGVHRAITSEIGFRNTANPSVLQSLDLRPQPPHSPGARLATQRVSPPPHAGP